MPTATMLTHLLSRLMQRAAVADSAREIDEWLQQGYHFQQEKNYAQAEQLYRRALNAAPDNINANYLLGALLGESGDLGRAAIHLERAVAFNPDFADAFAALGNVRLLQGDKDAAMASYERSVLLDPDSAATHSNLGLLYQGQGNHAAALREFQRAHYLLPDLPYVLRNITLAHIELEQHDAALAFIEALLVAQPLNYEALKCKGFVLQKMHRPDHALGCYQKAREIVAGDPELLNNFGIVLQDLGRLDEAIECYDNAISLQPDFPLAIWHRSLAYLLRYDFARGWTGYECRFLSADQARRPQDFPQWTGDSLAGRGILIYAEQGLGDEIMFASCLPDAIAASAHCVVECSPRLETLFRRSFPSATVRAATPGETTTSSPRDSRIDVQSPMGSLPRHLRHSYDEFPHHQGYLRADAECVSLWRDRLAQVGPGLKIGISWQGGTLKTRQQTRSLPLAHWLPILRTPGVQFVNLQYTESSAELMDLQKNTGIQIHDWPEMRGDLEHAAGVITALDLIISVCTTVIHLSGALGRQVWIMAPHSPEWRYGIAGDKMPWYPTARIFRQPAYGQWGPVVADVARELAACSNRL